MTHRDSRRTFRIILATALVLYFIASIPVIMLGRAYSLGLWLLCPIHFVVGLACGRVACLLVPNKG